MPKHREKVLNKGGKQQKSTKTDMFGDIAQKGPLGQNCY
jgi:hypothetical protein